MRALHVLALLSMLSPSVFAQRVARDTFRFEDEQEIAREQGIDKAKKEVQVADVFVLVHAIRDGKIYGAIDSPVLIVGHKRGDLISFPESEIINWAIQRPDGSEEGNYVGKFMDHYKPK